MQCGTSLTKTSLVWELAHVRREVEKLSNDDRVEVDQKEPVRNANRGGCGRIVRMGCKSLHKKMVDMQTVEVRVSIRMLS